MISQSFDHGPTHAIQTTGVPPVRVMTRALWLLCFSLACLPVFASTWYVRPDGGTRYSSNMTKGQCDGTADAPYSGSGSNRHCAFKDVRSLWQDGSYADGSKFPAWGWIGKGGDTYLIRGSIANGVSYRIGWNNPSSAQDPASGLLFGLAGDPYDSGPPVPPSGTAAEHTRILGENFQACHDATARTQIHGGYGLFTVLDMRGASYVDVACLDVTDFSSCGRAGQANACNTSLGTLSDFASNGIAWSNTSTNDTLTDVRVHGLGGGGMLGPTGTGMVFSYLDLIANASSGWNADAGNRTTGTGTLLVQHYDISWNGCAEEYPITHPLPYTDCTDDNNAGYGDGFGTTTLDSNPAWNVTFDQGVVSNNTQDGLDALHINGAGSSMTVTHTLAFGNMGQQIKVGGAHGIITDNQIVTNCNALRQDIPGTPPGYNAKLSDFCRAADAGIAVTINNEVPLKIDNNIIYSASTTAIEIECAEESCGSSATIDFRNNIFVGFKNDAAHGYKAGGDGGYSSPIYIGAGTNPFKNPGSVYSDNVTYHANSSWSCPAPGEKRATCRDPHLADETWHTYGFGDMSPAKGAAPASTGGEAIDDGPSPGVLFAPGRRSGRRAIGCLCAGVLGLALWRRLRRDRER